MDIVEKRIEGSVYWLAGAPTEPFTKETLLVEDLGLDSLDGLELAMECEENFDVEIPDEAIGGWSTVGDVVKSVKKLQKEQ